MHEGGNPSSFKNVTEDVTISDGTGLYHIRGSNEFNTRAVQVDKTASALNSSDTFVLCGKDRVVVWYGKHGSKDERAAAASIAEVLRGAREWCEVEEGEEDQDFWSFAKLERTTAPNVANADRCATPIDAFIWRKLEADGLELSPEASRETLIRRVYFDLVGLPPSPADLDDAVARALARKAEHPNWYGTDWIASAHVNNRHLLPHPDMLAFYVEEGKWLDYLAARVPEYAQYKQ